jgi:hypothetical protein
MARQDDTQCRLCVPFRYEHPQSGGILNCARLLQDGWVIPHGLGRNAEKTERNY